MYLSESIYLKLPVPLQHIACSWVGWRIQQTRFGKSFQPILDETESRMFWPVEQTIAYRNEQLRDFIQECGLSVPFYRERFKQLGIQTEDIRSLEDLKSLPILTKKEVQEQPWDFVSSAVPRKKHIISHTSGTTGAGLRFVTTMSAVQRQWAVWWRYRRWHGIQPNTWCAQFTGRSIVPLSQTRPPFWRYNYPGKQVLFSGYHTSPVNLNAYIEELRRRRPPWFHGYPSLLALLAAHVLESGMELGYSVRWITTGAENLLPQQVELIQRAFGVRPKQHYGMAEAVANFSECELGKLHVDEDFAAVEFVPNPDGPGYRIVGTNFTNPANPLLRYDVQDLVTLSDAECSCGRPGRVVSRVDGRLEDYVVLKNGARLGRMDHIFKDMIRIREAQIHQKRPGEITIRVVRGTGYTQADEAALLRESRKRMGNDSEIRIEYLGNIERSSTGKLRFVITEIPEGQLT